MNMMWHTNSSLGIRIASLGILFLLFSISLGFPLAKAASFVLENQDVDYEIEGGTVTDMVLDSDFIELIVEIDSINDGILQISFPRVLFDAKFNDVDDIFFVIVDGFQTEYVEITSDVYSRTLIIPFFAGDTQIEIIGTTVLEKSLQEFISEIQYLITEKIMTIPTTQSGTSSSEEIPAWIKNNAGWWADDLIGDSDFVSGVQYLITEGIMSV